MKYSKQGTLDFAKLINKEECLKQLDSLITKEGYSEAKILTGDEIVLDMDCVEHKIASLEKRSPFKSMDTAFVTVSEHNKEVVFVEYRFNYENLKNLKKDSLLEKVSGSIAALNASANMNTNYYFVFNSNLKQQAILRFNRMNPSMPQQYKAVDMSDIIEDFFKE